MPAEWEPHEATWLGWPHEITDWPGKFAVIPWAFAEIVRHLSRVERVFLLVENRAAESRVRTMLKKSEANLDAVDFFRIPTDRGWMRDTGPICVRNEAGEVAYNNFLFNGWAKYPNHKKDAAVVAKANQKLKRDRKSTRLNSSHVSISYAVFCLKKKKKKAKTTQKQKKTKKKNAQKPNIHNITNLNAIIHTKDPTIMNTTDHQ